MPVSQFYLQSRKMPFMRLLLAFSAGIVWQWYANIPLIGSLLVFIIALLLYACFFFLPVIKRFRLQWLQGMFILAMMLAAGSFLCFIKNPLHQKSNYATVYKEGNAIIATVNEALLNKPKTYKANLVINGIYHNKTYTPATGTLIAYFDKAGVTDSLTYGTQIIFITSPQAIAGTNNPGAFNHQRFLLFQGITAQVYLKGNNFTILATGRGSALKSSILQLQNYILRTIRNFIPGQKEQSVAEALLIGYRNDLDKQLVQSYSNTGVVHIIAISGLHLGMIYGFILLLFSRFKSRRWYRFVMPVAAILILWLFTLLAGAVPSILRSAVTFTFLAVGVMIGRKSSVYNMLAASAFCLLLFNPYYLWDVGFQLSYMAVLGITLFTKPLHNLFYFQNKLLDKIWLATCVTMAAQVFTLPVVLYNFHQFPMLFLITNLLVIFLSEIILFALLFLVVIGGWAWLASIVGIVTQFLLWMMNSIIEYTEKIPYSVWTNIKTDAVQAWLLYACIILLALWLLYRLPKLLVYGLMVLFVMAIYISVDVWRTSHQQKLVVYNVQKHNAIDIITGQKATGLYDDSLIHDITAVSFTLKPSHTLYRISDSSCIRLPGKPNLSFYVKNRTILIISQPVHKVFASHKIKADFVVITGNPKLYMNDVLSVIDCNTVIADNNTSSYKIKKWREDCDSLHIRFYSIAQQGAFVADL